ncbi:hypothetical protein PENANT_c015G00226 [Penicillium antarcticum]|uniref:Uncharacterized protein n=1 Tax=Penicillium antarcticum TaxID=416450 RepID=A0A1V6Q3N7_9EURO|nr:hypothetical protein PENANT_c015G00226 [Penicillium antarcticum]
MATRSETDESLTLLPFLSAVAPVYSALKPQHAHPRRTSKAKRYLGSQFRDDLPRKANLK